ncbi:MAG: twin-arginine translocase TatA/TatE family subunit [Lysobacteraceae bacterium]
MGGFSIWHWLVVLVIVLLIFGTKRLTGGAKDVANAVKEFKKAIRDDDAKPPESKITDPVQQAVDSTKQAPTIAPGDDKTPRA